jgi:cystathionine beta-lyase
MTSEEMSAYLEKEARVIVQNGAAYGPPGEGYIRINVATAQSVLREAFDRIQTALMKLG